MNIRSLLLGRRLGEVELPVNLPIETLRELVNDLPRARQLGVMVFPVKASDIAQIDTGEADAWFIRGNRLVRRLKGQEHEYIHLGKCCYTPVNPSPHVKGLIVQVI